MINVMFEAHNGNKGNMQIFHDNFRLPLVPRKTI